MARVSVALLILLLAPAVHAIDCPTGEQPCGNQHCAPVDKVCCASAGHEELSCPMGTVCQTNGTCASGPTCPVAGGVRTLANCGGDSCSCSAPCRVHEDCESRCCSEAGQCAPACVCRGDGRLFLECQTTAAGYGGKPKSGCAFVAGAADGSGGWAFALLLLLIVMARRAQVPPSGAL
jgi:MYXO-CTERM domain-containing protein